MIPFRVTMCAAEFLLCDLTSTERVDVYICRFNSCRRRHRAACAFKLISLNHTYNDRHRRSIRAETFDYLGLYPIPCTL